MGVSGKPELKRKMLSETYEKCEKGPKFLDAAFYLCYTTRANGRWVFFLCSKLRPKHNVNYDKIKWRWKSCAQRSHWHVQNANNAITT